MMMDRHCFNRRLKVLHSSHASVTNGRPISPTKGGDIISLLVPMSMFGRQPWESVDRQVAGIVSKETSRTAHRLLAGVEGCQWQD